MLRNKKGFTLIELLIVVVVLGILAVAILSAINPIEQIAKARDSSKKSDSSEMLNALERYYTTFQEYPWGVTDISAGVLATDVSLNLSELVTKKEVKSEFLQRTNLGSMYVSEDADGLVHVCFLPEAATFQAQAEAKPKNKVGATVASCTAGTDCYICIPE